jgi:tetratricopeptide (TPR) repeat protein
MTRARQALGLLLALCLGVVPARAQVMGQDAEVGLGLIVVDSLDKAERVRAQLEAGGDFPALARANSVDQTASVGGNLGRVQLSALRPELRAGVQGLSVGQRSAILRIPNGYAILEVLPAAAAAGPGPSSLPLSVSATGNVRYVVSVDGLSVAEQAISRMPKPPGWDQDLRAVCEGRIQSHAAITKAVEGFLDPANPEGVKSRTNPVEVAQAWQLLADVRAYKGEMADVVKAYEVALGIARSFPNALPLLEHMTGVAYLHKAEMDNDTYRNPGERCLFPMASSLRYADTAASQKAIEHLTAALQLDADNLEARWLLNLAYRTTGAYPDGVPKQYLLPPSLFESEGTAPRFVDIAKKAGIDVFSMAGGIAVDDFDGDGRLDVVLSSFDMCQRLRFFHNQGDGTFVEKTDGAGLDDQLGGLSLNQTDYDNDGCRDILVMRGGWEIAHRKSLLRGHCNGTFTDVTAASGLAVPATATQGGVWVDIDNDGWLDLFVGSEDVPAQLFRSRGDGTFEDISASAGIQSPAFVKGAVAEDYDKDGFADIFVANNSGENLLFHNNHDRTFTEVGAKAGVRVANKTFSSWFFDYDNDGWPDLFVTSFFASVDETTRTYLKAPHNAPPLRLFKNKGDGTFREVTTEVRLDRVFMPMGANFGDIDNDGYLDIYLGTGNPSYASLAPNVMLRNQAGRTFADVTAASGTGDLHKGHGVAFADIDNDGDEDLLTVIGGATPGDTHAFRFFENPGNGSDWLSLKLVGVKSNRAAVGAHLQITVENDGKNRRSLYRTVGSGGSFGASPFEQHVGLGPKARVVSVEVSWPASGTHQTFTGVAKNQAIEIRELDTKFTPLRRERVRPGRQGK